jgi:hypothetical protein
MAGSGLKTTLCTTDLISCRLGFAQQLSSKISVRKLNVRKKNMISMPSIDGGHAYHNIGMFAQSEGGKQLGFIHSSGVGP